MRHDDVVLQQESGPSREVVGPEVDACGVGGGEEGGGGGDVAAEPGSERLGVDVGAVEQL